MRAAGAAAKELNLTLDAFLKLDARLADKLITINDALHAYMHAIESDADVDHDHP